MTAQQNKTPRRTLAEWARLVESLHPKNIEMGLDRIRIVKDRLNIHFDCPVVIVGGTNGKGSTCAMLQTVWKEAGYKTGLYTSPHIHRFNERMRINGIMADDETLVDYFEKVEAARGDVALTFFEFTTLVALKLFTDAKLDVAVLEVGLGGRLDAVNLLDADVAVVTNVDIDHVAFLGDTREKIGFEKAGIYRGGRKAFYVEANPPASLVSHAEAIGADLKIYGRDFGSKISGGAWDYDGEKPLYGLPFPSLYGENQVRNAAGVLAALQALSARLPVSREALEKGLLHTELPGRFQILQQDPCIILDVAHNPHAAAVLARNLGAMRTSGMTHAVFGAMADKDIDGVISLMKGSVSRWYLTDLPLPRAAPAALLKEKLAAAGIAGSAVSLYANAAEAFSGAKNNAGKNDRIVAFGSFWVVTGVTEDIDLEIPANHR